MTVYRNFNYYLLNQIHSQEHKKYKRIYRSLTKDEKTENYLLWKIFDDIETLSYYELDEIRRGLIYSFYMIHHGKRNVKVLIKGDLYVFWKNEIYDLYCLYAGKVGSIYNQWEKKYLEEESIYPIPISSKVVKLNDGYDKEIDFKIDYSMGKEHLKFCIQTYIKIIDSFYDKDEKFQPVKPYPELRKYRRILCKYLKLFNQAGVKFSKIN